VSDPKALVGRRKGVSATAMRSASSRIGTNSDHAERHGAMTAGYCAPQVSVNSSNLARGSGLGSCV
jgi:hypothetical protein